MQLEKLINQIKKETQKEIETLKQEHDSVLEKINRKQEKEIKEIEKQQEKKTDKHRKKILMNYQKDTEFQIKMQALKLKKELISQAISQAKQQANNFSIEQKKKIFKDKIDEINKYLKDDYIVFVPKSKKNDFNGIVDLNKVQEKELNFSNGFVIENDKIIFEVSLDSLIDELIEKDNDYFANVLFKK